MIASPWVVGRRIGNGTCLGHRRDHRAGFALVELLVVMAVIGILAGIAVPRYRGLQERTQFSVLAADLYHLRLMQERHRNGGDGSYASDMGTLADVLQPSPGVVITIVDASDLAYTAIAAYPNTDRRCVYTSIDGTVTCGRSNEGFRLGNPSRFPGTRSDTALGTG